MSVIHYGTFIAWRKINNTAKYFIPSQCPLTVTPTIKLAGIGDLVPEDKA